LTPWLVLPHRQWPEIGVITIVFGALIELTAAKGEVAGTVLSL